MPRLINFWNPHYLKQNKTTVNEEILLCIYICNYFNGNSMMKLKSKADKVFEILDEFPNVDALEDSFSEDLDVAKQKLSNYLETLD
jgi:hypothetical protein